MSDVIITSICEKCRYGTIHDENKARIKVWCSYKEREYFYGACIPCTNYIKAIEGDNTNE